MFETCLKTDELKRQAAYARGICHRESGRSMILPDDLADEADETGVFYVACNLSGYLSEKGYKARVEPYGKTATTLNVVADIDGSTYLLQISAMYDAFSNWAWRKTPNGTSISIADPDANPRPTKTDQYVLSSIISQASSLPLSFLGEDAVKLITAIEAKAKEKPKDVVFCQYCNEMVPYSNGTIGGRKARWCGICKKELRG